MRAGFSLVELSIVLVILGLLTGGILAGQSLIRASQLRAVTMEYQRFLTAIHTFRDEYFAIPGDMKNAQSFWGVAHATPATCIITASTTTATCNGDGDGKINPSDSTTAAGSNETFRFWQHLANAGLIEGNYDGITHGASSNAAVLGTNVPASKLNNGGWSSFYIGNYGGGSVAYAMDYGNVIAYGAYLADNWPAVAVLRPEEAWNIDTKLDDGKPAAGKVIARFWNNACAAADDGTHANNDLVASYKLTDSSIQCALYFRQAF